MNTKEYETLNKYYDFLCEKYGEKHILGVFLYGSQNYGINTPNSDIDAKAIYVPSFEDLVEGRILSKELHWAETDTHIEIKDIREMVKMWKKMNMNFLEIMFTEYFVLNPMYEPFWTHLGYSFREDIAHYNKYAAITSAYYQAKNTISSLNIVGKQYVNASRMCDYFERYLDGEPYFDCIHVPAEKVETYIKYKIGELTPTLDDIAQLITKLDSFKLKADMLKETLSARDTLIDRRILDWMMRIIRELDRERLEK